LIFKNISDNPNKLILLDVFSYSCMNCLRSLGYIKQLDKKYNRYGLKTILIHPPEWSFEKKEENIFNVLKKHEIRFPIITDKNKKIIKRLGIGFWPAQVLIKNNKILYKHIGEGNYKNLEEKIRSLLRIKQKKVFSSEPRYSKLPAIYLGKRKRGKVKFLKENIRFGIVYKKGKWIQTDEYLQHIGKNGSLTILTKWNVINFTASPVNNKAAIVSVKLDDGFNKKLVINNPDLYEIAKIKENKMHKLTISTKSRAKIYSFSFQ